MRLWRYYLLLGAASYEQGLGWGGIFRRKRFKGENQKDEFSYARSDQRILVRRFEAAEAAGWPARDRALYGGLRPLISWDQAHVQRLRNWAHPKVLAEGYVEPEERPSIPLSELGKRGGSKP